MNNRTLRMATAVVVAEGVIGRTVERKKLPPRKPGRQL